MKKALPRATLLAFSLLCAPSSAQTRTDQDEGAPSSGFSTSSSSWEGLSEFVRLAERRVGPERIQLRATLDYDALDAHDALLILHPEVPLDADALTHFLSGGGRVALVDDFGSSSDFLARFKVRRIPPPHDPVLVVDHNPNLAIAVPASQRLGGIEQARHPMTEQVDLVVTNHASAFSHPTLTPVLEIEGSDGTTLPIAVTGIIPKTGRLVVIGDPSIFINLMLRYPGNRAFAVGLLDYLQAREGAENRGRIWIVSGRFSQRGSFGKQSLRDDLLARFRAARSALTDVDAQGLPPSLSLVLAVCALLWLLRFEVAEQLKGPLRVTPSFARRAPVAAQSGLLGRAELLAAPTTTPVLGLIELAAGLEETLTEKFGSPPPTSPSALVSWLGEGGLDRVQASAVARSLGELRGYQRALASGKRVRASERELKRIHGEVKRLLGMIQENSRKPGA